MLLLNLGKCSEWRWPVIYRMLFNHDIVVYNELNNFLRACWELIPFFTISGSRAERLWTSRKARVWEKMTKKSPAKLTRKVLVGNFVPVEFRNFGTKRVSPPGSITHFLPRVSVLPLNTVDINYVTKKWGRNSTRSSSRNRYVIAVIQPIFFFTNHQDVLVLVTEEETSFSVLHSALDLNPHIGVRCPVLQGWSDCRALFEHLHAKFSWSRIENQFRNRFFSHTGILNISLNVKTISEFTGNETKIYFTEV